MRVFYIIACILGTILPFSVFLPWVVDHGLSPLLMISEASQTRIGAFAWLDVIVSASDRD